MQIISAMWALCTCNKFRENTFIVLCCVLQSLNYERDKVGVQKPKQIESESMTADIHIMSNFANSSKYRSIP